MQSKTFAHCKETCYLQDKTNTPLRVLLSTSTGRYVTSRGKSSVLEALSLSAPTHGHCRSRLNHERLHIVINKLCRKLPALSIQRETLILTTALACPARKRPYTDDVIARAPPCRVRSSSLFLYCACAYFFPTSYRIFYLSDKSRKLNYCRRRRDG